MKRIIVFRVGKWGKCLLEYKRKDDTEIICICDNHKDVIGHTVCKNVR